MWTIYCILIVNYIGNWITEHLMCEASPRRFSGASMTPLLLPYSVTQLLLIFLYSLVRIRTFLSLCQIWQAMKFLIGFLSQIIPFSNVSNITNYNGSNLILYTIFYQTMCYLMKIILYAVSFLLIKPKYMLGRFGILYPFSDLFLWTLFLTIQISL